MARSAPSSSTLALWAALPPMNSRREGLRCYGYGFTNPCAIPGEGSLMTATSSPSSVPAPRSSPPPLGALPGSPPHHQPNSWLPALGVIGAAGGTIRARVCIPLDRSVRRHACRTCLGESTLRKRRPGTPSAALNGTLSGGIPTAALAHRCGTLASETRINTASLSLGASQPIGVATGTLSRLRITETGHPLHGGAVLRFGGLVRRGGPGAEGPRWSADGPLGRRKSRRC